MCRLAFFTISLALALFAVDSPIQPTENPKEANPTPSMEQAKDAKPVTEKERRFAHDMQEIFLPGLELAILGYETKLVKIPRNADDARARHAKSLELSEQNVRDQVERILKLDPDTEIAEKARKILKRLEILKKKGRVM
jgi:hypothetical protein